MKACDIPGCHCGNKDLLIHQNCRGPHESSSGYGQHIHDNYPPEFFWTDMDGIIKKNFTGVFRMIEHKGTEQYLSNGQREVLPLLALALQPLIGDCLDEQSGVFVVYSDPPHCNLPLIVTHVLPQRRFRHGPRVELLGKDRICFETGHRLDDVVWKKLCLSE